MTRRGYARDFLKGLLTQVRDDAPLYLFIAIYTLAGLTILKLADAEDQMAYTIYLVKWISLFGLMLPAIALVLDYGILLHRFDRRRNLAAAQLFSAPRMARFFAGIVLLLAFMAFQGTFTSVKNALPIFTGGFPYDRIQADVDAAMHFGIDPWRWLYAIGQHDAVRAIVEWNYNFLWFVFCFGALFFIVTSPRAKAIRTRYLVSFMLVWIVLGNVLAGLFMSAGPAFYAAVTGDSDRFADQLSFLAQSAGSGHSAADYQHYLWMLHSSGQAGFGSGISAFPSVHVGLVALNALFLMEYGRRLGIAAFAYVALIVANSVYLAWHYAIDGYAAVVVTLLIYLATRRLMPRVRAIAAMREAVVGSGAGHAPRPSSALTAS